MKFFFSNTVFEVKVDEVFTISMVIIRFLGFCQQVNHPRGSDSVGVILRCLTKRNHSSLPILCFIVCLPNFEVLPILPLLEVPLPYLSAFASLLLKIYEVFFAREFRLDIIQELEQSQAVFHPRCDKMSETKEKTFLSFSPKIKWRHHRKVRNCKGVGKLRAGVYKTDVFDL